MNEYQHYLTPNFKPFDPIELAKQTEKIVTYDALTFLTKHEARADERDSSLSGPEDPLRRARIGVLRRNGSLGRSGQL